MNSVATAHQGIFPNFSVSTISLVCDENVDCLTRRIRAVQIDQSLTLRQLDTNANELLMRVASFSLRINENKQNA